jgi:hypothetical protein
MPTLPTGLAALANRLSKYGIGSKALRVGYDVVKGYPRAQFQEPRIRYLDDETSTTLRSHRKIDYIGYKRNIPAQRSLMPHSFEPITWQAAYPARCSSR